MRKIVFFVGESGCGKTHLQDALMKLYPFSYTRIISTTTRPPRPGEENGISYHFLKSNGEFRRLLTDGRFLQHVEYGGTYYGTQLKEYKQKENNGIFVCTPEGINDTINALKKNCPADVDMKMQFEIVYFMATKELLINHGISQDRIDRGNITENFTKRYYNDEFKGIPLTIVTADQVNDGLLDLVHKKIF